MFGKMLTLLGFALANRASNGTFCERASGTYGNTKLAPCPQPLNDVRTRIRGVTRARVIADIVVRYLPPKRFDSTHWWRSLH